MIPSIQKLFSLDSGMLQLLTNVIYPSLISLKGAYWISSNSSFIQYCDSNIGTFSNASPLVIALPTLL